MDEQFKKFYLKYDESYETPRKVLAEPTDILITCAAQSMDQVSLDWTKSCALSHSEFRPPDANYPVKFPKRQFYKAAYQVDAPLSAFGERNAKLIGRQAQVSHFKPPRIFSGPSLKCLDTSRMLGSFLKQQPVICVEHGIWGEFSKLDAGLLLGLSECKTFEYPVDPDYQSLVSSKLVDKCRTVNDWVHRTVKTFETILTENKHDNVIFVVDQLAMKVLVARCLYRKFEFKTEALFNDVSHVNPGATLMFNRIHTTNEILFKEPERPFPSLTTKVLSTQFDYDKLYESIEVIDISMF